MKALRRIAAQVRELAGHAGQAEQALGALAEALATYARGEALARGEQPGPAERAWPAVCPHCGERHLGRDWCGARKGVGSW